jgi:hypothetical protein
MAILIVAVAAVVLVVLSRRSAPWWASALVIALVALPWVAGYVDEVGDDDTSPGLLVFGGVLSVGALLVLELALRIHRRRGRR